MAMQEGLKVFLFSRLATNQCGCDEKIDFARLTAILEETVKDANEKNSDAAGCSAPLY